MHGTGSEGAFPVAILGGGIGEAHVEAFRSLPDRFAVVAICDVDLSRAREIAAKYGIPRAAASVSEVLEDDDVDIVDICTPSYLHVQQSLAALRHGKHVICEKPVAGSLRAVDALIQAEAESGHWLMPIFQNRFGQGVQQARHLHRLGVTGRAYLATVETHWRRRPGYYAAPWRGRWGTELGGPLVTLAIHAHDVLTYLLGSVSSVAAHTATLVNPIETEDCATASLCLQNGALAAISVTTGSAQQLSRMRICFENLTCESKALPYYWTAAPWSFVGDTERVDRAIGAALDSYDARPEGFVGQFVRLHDALVTDRSLPVTLADARASVELITALYKSAWMGRSVSLPITAEDAFYAGWQGSDGQPGPVGA